MIDEDTIQRVARRLAEAGPARTRILLFGSHARGEADAASDLDLLVVEPELDDGFEETVRLTRVANELRVPADVVVVSERAVAEWGAVEGSFLHAALTEGRLLARA